MDRDDWAVYFVRYFQPTGEFWESLYMMITGEIMDERYVKYTDMRHYWFRAVLDRDELSLRMSRKRFKRAGEAKQYRRAVLDRLERLRACR